MLKMYVLLSGVDFKKYKETGYGLSFGGYCMDVKVKGKVHTINFDFDSFCAGVTEDGDLSLDAGEKTFFGGSAELSSDYDEEYKKAGFLRKDLTASVMSKATAISEFCIDYVGNEQEFKPIFIKEMSFLDELGEYPVKEEVFKKAKFNLLYEEPEETLDKE